METSSVFSPNATSSQAEPRQKPQAGPLPKKRGEIGFTDEQEEQEGDRSSSPDIVLPARHPADRDPEQGVAADATQATTNAQMAIAHTSPSDTTSTINSISAAKQKGRRLLGLFKCKGAHKPLPRAGGVTLPTLVKFSIQTLLLSGTIVAWAFTAKLLQDMRNRGAGGPTSTIFVHVVFGICALGQILLLERRIFRIRAERYSYLHHGDILPSFRNRHTASSDLIALSPWNRPPLPTYAAVLAQSGRGTGDVEDHVIAQQPPPAYGQTRGSTFLLAGFLDENLRLQRPPSVHSATSRLDRPRSYVSRDDEWNEIQNADRAMRLEETLATLERSASRSSRSDLRS
ncbi:hypothetical protein P691DRAFT_807518 [Macrolepiota fuliginosa MF-IS2]|uniref:Uncharacterized protein n=1 Tax=Macrolepiota fuliginosa MF-IS2 TaxID=1400762 RepID=A0A9P5X629_9AGAR|nr:hypothetical protein P691DRAFT_807518 [Macrolepiota fuliginosa MF-IS2]